MRLVGHTNVSSIADWATSGFIETGSPPPPVVLSRVVSLFNAVAELKGIA